MPNKKTISDLRNYTNVLKEVDELDKMVVLRGLMKDLNRAKERADREGWIDADEAERILGVST